MLNNSLKRIIPEPWWIPAGLWSCLCAGRARVSESSSSSPPGFRGTPELVPGCDSRAAARISAPCFGEYLSWVACFAGRVGRETTPLSIGQEVAWKERGIWADGLFLGLETGFGSPARGRRLLGNLQTRALACWSLSGAVPFQSSCLALCQESSRWTRPSWYLFQPFHPGPALYLTCWVKSGWLSGVSHPSPWISSRERAEH